MRMNKAESVGDGKIGREICKKRRRYLGNSVGS